MRWPCAQSCEESLMRDCPSVSMCPVSSTQARVFAKEFLNGQVRQKASLQSAFSEQLLQHRVFF